MHTCRNWCQGEVDPTYHLGAAGPEGVHDAGIPTCLADELKECMPPRITSSSNAYTSRRVKLLYLSFSTQASGLVPG